MQAKAVALKTRPEGMPKPDDFQIIDIVAPEPKDGQIQVKNLRYQNYKYNKAS